MFVTTCFFDVSPRLLTKQVLCTEHGTNKNTSPSRLLCNYYCPLHSRHQIHPSSSPSALPKMHLERCTHQCTHHCHRQPQRQVDAEIIDSTPHRNVYLSKRDIKGETRLAVTAHGEGEVGVCSKNYLAPGTFVVTRCRH